MKCPTCGKEPSTFGEYQEDMESLGYEFIHSSVGNSVGKGKCRTLLVLQTDTSVSVCNRERMTSDDTVVSSTGGNNK